MSEATITPAAFRRLCVETTSRRRKCRFGRPAAFRRLCVETIDCCISEKLRTPAAFRRLCVETTFAIYLHTVKQRQPPLGGCVLKRLHDGLPLRLCFRQPPLGGCVLKRYAPTTATASAYPAAFRRLCVETRAFLWAAV